MFLFTCMHARIYIHRMQRILTYMHTCTHKCTHAYTHAYINVLQLIASHQMTLHSYIRKCKRTYILHIYLYTHTRKHKHLHIYIYIYIYICACTHMCAHTYTHTCIHTYTLRTCCMPTMPILNQMHKLYWPIATLIHACTRANCALLPVDMQWINHTTSITKKILAPPGLNLQK